MIPEAAHKEYSKWAHNYKDDPRPINEANKRYQEKKLLQLSMIAFKHTNTQAEYEDLFKELQLHYDTSTPPANYYDKAPDHNEKVNIDGMKVVFMFLIIVMADLTIFTFIIYLKKNTNLALLSIPITTAVVYGLIMISRMHNKIH